MNAAFLCWLAGEFRRTSTRDDQSQDGEPFIAHVRRGADTDLHSDAARLVSEVSQLADLQTVARQQQSASAAAVFTVAARARVATPATAATAADAAAAAAGLGLQLKNKHFLQIVHEAFSLRDVRIRANLLNV